MEKNKRIEATQQLPKEMIQHIQSFLNGKEAAQTTILSKSWYTAWLTRPNLDFDECYHISENYLTPLSESVFVKLTNKTMQRYEELNLKIHSFSLNIECSYNKPSLANKWTTRAMKLGATDIEIQCGECNFDLPREVLESETLVKLSLSGGRIDLRDLHNVSYSRLKSLILSIDVCIEGDSLWDIISMCPSIEEFVLSPCEKLVLKPRLGVNDFPKLKVLTLEWVEIGEWFFRDLSSKFPCLKELSLRYCTDYEEIQICSNSLECIDLCHGRTSYRVKLEVPRIRKFSYLSSCVPSLSFKTTSSREWQSNISFDCNVDIDSSWFVKLRNFLMELKSSKISLTLTLLWSNGYSLEEVNLTIEPPIVQKVAFGMGAPSTLSKELFWTCRPEFITLATKDFVNTPIKQEFEDVITSSLYDLEEVNVQFLQGAKWTWTPPLPTGRELLAFNLY